MSTKAMAISDVKDIALDKKTTWPSYESYVYSNIPWMGEIPTTWQIAPLKRIGWFRAGGGFPDGEQGLTDEELPFFKVADMNNDGNEVLMQTANNSVSYTTARKLRAPVFSPDTIIFPKVGAALLLNKRRILVRPSCIDNNTMGFRVEHADTKYLYYRLLIIDLGRLANPGAVPSINEGQLRDIDIALPSLSEQRAIALFLDARTSKIDALVKKKVRLIELLQEKRTALISYAVTKGLNPAAPLKDSGIDWLGQIPAHWTTVALRYITDLQTGLTLGKKYNSETMLISRPYLRVANVQDGYLDLATITTVEIPAEDALRYELRDGDVVMTEGGDFDKLGRGYVWEDQIAACLHQNHIFAVRPHKDRLNPQFLAALMTSGHGKTYFTSTASQTTNLATTNSTKLKSFPVLLPSLNEQREILDYIQNRAKALGALLAKVTLAIERLREYRTALISAAVTGKIDVRGHVEGGK